MLTENAENIVSDVSDSAALPEMLNRTTRPYPRHASLPALFAAQAAVHPDATALLFQDTRLTYGELNRRSNRLAHKLRTLGVGANTLVAISLDRSPDMITALLGILKAGGAYLPLDPDAPKARQEFVLQDAAVSLILTQESRKQFLPESSARVLCMDSDREQWAQESEENPAWEIGAEDLAYVLFTSGSTGTPKGVMVPHRAVVRLVCNTDFVHLDANETLLCMAPLAFDASTFEIWGALLNGATLAILPPQASAPCEIGAARARYGVTTLWLTAGLFHLMVEEQLDALRGLRQLLAGGDVLPVPQVRKAIENLPGCQIINGYGPTETTTFACCCRIDAVLPTNGSVPIGRPIANTRAYILNDNLQPAAFGTPGELVIGGDGVARGYLNRPEDTAAKFLPDPFHAEPNARMYRTGDRARYLPDGTIEFLGRVDNQIKIRGYRIELGEIEAALLQHSAIGAAAVIAAGAMQNNPQLTAYLTVRPGAAPNAATLRAFLRERLPEHGLPAFFRVLSAMPLTPNGKINRAGLESCPGEPLPSGIAFVAPRSDTERMVADIWQTVLEVAHVGTQENFFDLGGDSLRLTVVHGRLQEAFGLEIALTDLFQYPTVSALAGYLHAARAVAIGQTAQAMLAANHRAASDRAAQQKAALARRQQAVKGRNHV